MPDTFYNFPLEDFTELLNRFPFKRRINAVHFHHTFRPNHSQYKEKETLQAMWLLHTQIKGWSDLASHLIIAPDGEIWLGRNWNQPPVSAAGHNGNNFAGPFMISAIGDFNAGGDSFSGSQREVTLNVIAQIQRLFGLPVESLYFHNQLSAKSCPGNSISYDETLKAVAQIHHKMDEGKSKPGGRKGIDASPFGPEARAENATLQEVVKTFNQTPSGRSDPVDAELDDEDMTPEEINLFSSSENLIQPASSRSGQERATRAAWDPTLPEVRAALRPHVINLSEGQFSSDGLYSTQPGDVDAIFSEYLEQRLAEAKKKKQKLRLLFFAHGGLVKETDGLGTAYKHIPWWLDNNVYPIYFVWETGFFETIGHLLFGAQQHALPGVARDIYDVTTDPAVEFTVHQFGGVPIWAGMKRSAERSVLKPTPGVTKFDGGGAYYVAKKLKAFCDTHGPDVELHAAGHSAGSIFHAYFLSTALDLKVPGFRSVQFLAPAIRTDDFSRLLSKWIGRGIDQLTIFTMAKDWEQADNCANIYHKSLLYLIYYALETKRATPILGLEESLRSDANLTKLFSLNGHASKVGEVVWARSLAASGRSASTATSHGCFDDDGPTMNSILRRILGQGDTLPIKDYPQTTTDCRSDFGRSLDAGRSFSMLGYPPLDLPSTQPQLPLPQPATLPPSGIPQSQGGRRALCVGIDTYRAAPLHGCVADSQMWADTFNRLGFQVISLRNSDATHDMIIKALIDLVTASQPGDVIAFQYAGHGTQVKDINQDEQGGDSPQLDEALCPYDYDLGRLIIDDDIAEVFSRIPEGVNMTCFMDCCHSGTISRFGIGAPGQEDGMAQDQRPRYIVADAALEAAHRRFRESRPKFRAVSSRGPSTMKEVIFSACNSNEVAWESNGHGDFTVQATSVLKTGLAGLSNEAFQERVTLAFGPGPRQHPDLDCAITAKERGLLQPLTDQTPARLVAGGQMNLPNGDGLEAVAQGLKLLADLLIQRR